MNQKPLVSVIIPSKNRSEMVARAIKTVQKQTYKNLEIMVINDASTDETAEILDTIKKTDSRITVFHNVRSLGGAGARNVGLKNTHGDYIAFLDDDDEWLPTKTEAQIKFLHEHPDVKAVSCWYLLKVNNKIQQIQKPSKITFDDLLWENFLGSFSFCCITKEVLNRIGLLDESLPSAQDWDFWLRVSREFNVRTVEQYLAVYNQHSQARISSSYASKLRGREMAYKKYIRYMKPRCQHSHQKYTCYYRFLIEQKRLKKIKYLIKLLHYFDNKQDILLFLNSLGHFILPRKIIEKLEANYRTIKMNRNTYILDPEEYKKLYG